MYTYWTTYIIADNFFKIGQLRQQTDTSLTWVSHRNLPYAHHRKHNRIWCSKNLWCTSCNGICAICSSACCAYRKAWIVFNDQNSLPLEKTQAARLAKDITTWIPVGNDEPVFMRCNGCKRLVCPMCCSVCPVDLCQDLLCRVCQVIRRVHVL